MNNVCSRASGVLINVRQPTLWREESNICIYMVHKFIPNFTDVKDVRAHNLQIIIVQLQIPYNSLILKNPFIGAPGWLSP